MPAEEVPPSEGATPRPPGAPDVTGGAAPGQRPLDVPSWFFEELATSFARHRPQESLRWNFLDAYNRLDRVFGAGSRQSELLDDVAAATGRRPGRGRGGIARRPGRTTPNDEHVDGRTEEALRAAVEAFRYLLARVEILEDRGTRQRRPIDGLAWLFAPPSLAGWSAAVTTWLAAHPPRGEMLLGESGDGALASSIADAGHRVLCVEPRAALAADAATAGLRVEVAEVIDRIEGRPSSALGALVLSGVTDYEAREQLFALPALLRDRLAHGAPLLLSATHPTQLERTGVALDLAPGRPLHPDTWALLLDRAGFTHVAALEGRPSDPSYVVGAVSP